MTPKITPEIRKAIDEQHGKPVFVVDADRHQTFVLLTSDDFQRVEPFLGYSPDEGEWTDAKESRRRELIDKDIAGSITSDEKGELAVLDRQGNDHYDKIAPRPIEGVRQLHQELLQKRDHD
ncbi:MAG: hypothetical protein KDA59_25815 [Planctomycetales bacterium]|nr:hypothetical protein [Planctomycetales bacterium]